GFGSGYGDDVLKAKEVLESIVADNPRVLADPPPFIGVSELGDSSVNFAVRPYVNVDDFIPVQFELTEAVKLRFDEANISIPFPQRDVHLFQEAV
ncbi:MAG: mechanosensitive ion channel family protein, partial [Anaerolineae bacterium]